MKNNFRYIILNLFFVGVLLMAISCTPDSNTIKIKGSDTEVNLAVQLAEGFRAIHSGVFVSISGGGSGLGIASLLNGTADIANSSRRINSKEIDLFLKKSIELDSFIFAQDAIAFVVSEDLPIDSISTKDLALVLNGSYNSWKSLSGIDLPVTIYGRQSNSGTHEYIKKKLNISFSQHAKQMSGNAQILEAIRADNSGIGYVGAGYIIQGSNKGIKVLSIYADGMAISPIDKKMIAEGKYFFQTPLFQYFKRKSASRIKPFIDFERTLLGQEIINSAGYYPL